MHQYSVWAPFERITFDIAGPFPASERRNRYLLIAMDCFTKWLEAYAIPNQEASTVANVPVTNYFCHFRVPRELHSNQGWNFESQLMQEVLQHLEISITWTNPLHLQSDGERRVVSAHQRDWDNRLPTFLLAYRTSIHETTGSMPAGMVFGKELHLPCDLLFWAPPNKDQYMTDYEVDIMDQLHDIHHYPPQNPTLGVLVAEGETFLDGEQGSGPPKPKCEVSC
jgi:hypothetical protein